MTGTLGLNLLDSCDNTSASRGWCFSIFLIFMIRTIAACEQSNKTWLHQRHQRQFFISRQQCVIIKKDSYAGLSA